MADDRTRAQEVAITDCALKMRVWTKQLTAALRQEGVRAKPERVLTLAENICPTTQAFGGGMLFLHWFFANGKRTNWDWARREPEWGAGLRAEILKHEVPRWLMSVICVSNNISQKNTDQLFYPSLLLEWKGLSRSGMDLYAKLGVALRAKQYVSMKQNLALAQRAVSQEILDRWNP